MLVCVLITFRVTELSDVLIMCTSPFAVVPGSVEVTCVMAPYEINCALSAVAKQKKDKMVSKVIILFISWYLNNDTNIIFKMI